MFFWVLKVFVLTPQIKRSYCLYPQGENEAHGHVLAFPYVLVTIKMSSLGKAFVFTRKPWGRINLAVI